MIFDSGVTVLYGYYQEIFIKGDLVKIRSCQLTKF